MKLSHISIKNTQENQICFLGYLEEFAFHKYHKTFKTTQFDILLLAVLEGTYRKIPSQREVWMLLNPRLASYSIVTSTKIPITPNISSYAISQIHSLENSKSISHKLSKERQSTSKVRKQLL